MSEFPVTVHHADRAGTIVQLNPAWIDFGRANLYPGDPAAALGQSLWEHISDLETRYLYQELVRKVLVSQAPLRLEYRCDSPNLRRFMEMTIRCEPETGRVAFVNRIVRTEGRPYQSLLDPAKARTGERFLRLCSWCKRAEHPVEEWVEIEQVAARLRLFDDMNLPRLTHGICPRCKERVRAVEL